MHSNDYAFGQEDINTVTVNDGNVYKTVTIGSQVWMAENLPEKIVLPDLLHNNQIVIQIFFTNSF